MKIIAYVIVHYRGVQSTVALVDSIIANIAEAARQQVWIVDNSECAVESQSLVDELSVCVSKLERLEIVKTTNIGYFRSANVVSSYFSDYDYVVICNNDLVLSSKFLMNLAVKDYPSQTMVVYPDVISDGRVHENPRSIGPVSRLRILVYQLYYSNYLIARMINTIYIAPLGRLRRFREVGRDGSKAPFDIMLGVGACIVLTDHFFVKIAKLPEDVFLFGEEALLAERVLDNGGRLLYDSTLIVSHAAHSSVSKMPKKDYWLIQKNSAEYFIPALIKLSKFKERL